LKTEKRKKKNFFIAVFLLVMFVLWTAAVSFIDVEAIGPRGSEIGLASVNGFVHRIVGVHMVLYVITDWLSLIPVAFGSGFGILGLVQLIRRKKIKMVDFDILVLGGFYIAMAAAYLFFERFVINYRPIIIDGYLEASYPSSTTVLVICLMTTAAMQLNSRIKNVLIRRCIVYMINIFTVFMVTARFVSGVHWTSDIVGGILLSLGLVMLYRAFVCKV